MAPGDEVVLLGRQGDEEITAAEWAARLGTISYEVLTGIGPRVPRVTKGEARAGWSSWLMPQQETIKRRRTGRAAVGGGSGWRGIRWTDGREVSGRDGGAERTPAEPRRRHLPTPLLAVAGLAATSAAAYVVERRLMRAWRADAERAGRRPA